MKQLMQYLILILSSILMAACSGDLFTGGGSVVTNTDPALAINSSDENISSSSNDTIDNDEDKKGEVVGDNGSSTTTEESSEDLNFSESSEDSTEPPRDDSSENADESSETQESSDSKSDSDMSSEEDVASISSESESSASAGISSEAQSTPHDTITHTASFIEAESYHPNVSNSDVSIVLINDMLDQNNNNESIDELDNSQLLYYISLEDAGEYLIKVRAFGESTQSTGNHTLKIEFIDEATSQIIESNTYEIPADDTWSTTTKTYDLPKGDMIMKITPEGDNYQINYFEIDMRP